MLHEPLLEAGAFKTPSWAAGGAARPSPPRYPHSTEVAGFEPKFRADDRHGSLRGLVQSPARADRNKHLAVGGFRPPQVTHRLHKFLGAPVYRLYRFQVRFSIHLVHLKGLCTLTTAS